MKNFILLSSLFLLVGCGDSSTKDINEKVQIVSKSPEEYNEFEKAIADNRIDEVRALLVAEKIKEVTNDHITIAIEQGHLDMIRVLYNDDESVNHNGMTMVGTSLAIVGAFAGILFPPLWLASAAIAGTAIGLAHFTDIEFVSSLKVNTPNSQGETPLRVAIRENKKIIVSYFVNALNAAIFLETEQGLDAIEYAEQVGSSEEIQKLLKDSKFNKGQIKEMFKFTDYLEVKGDDHGTDFYQAEATTFKLKSSDEEKEELYQYARKNNVFINL